MGRLFTPFIVFALELFIICSGLLREISILILKPRKFTCLSIVIVIGLNAKQQTFSHGAWNFKGKGVAQAKKSEKAVKFN